MKLRIDPSKISFRLDFDELMHLKTHGDIQEVITLPQGHLTYKVISLPAGGAPEFEVAGPLYTLSLPQDMIAAHHAALPSLDGIICCFPCQQGGTITVSLEVNLKKSRQRAHIS